MKPIVNCSKLSAFHPNQKLVRTSLRLFLYFMFIFTGLLPAACNGGAANGNGPTSTFGIITPFPKPTASKPLPEPSPTGIAVPSEATEISPIAPITLADNGSTITLSVGQTFLLDLGDGYTWEVEVDDPGILSREVNILVIKGAQGIYKANAPGTTALTATGDPLCRQSTPPCMAPSIAFHVQVIVHPN
jgi:hypothetical protein